jgi:hypothetical protein
MSAVLQVAVAQAAIAISVFNLMIYLWLGMTVLLNGARQSRVTWIGGIGLLAAALFFLCHGALVGSGLPEGPSPVDFWWRLAWAPAFIAPFLWAATGLRYADLTGAWRRWRLPALQAVAALGVIAAALTIPAWPAIANYGDFIRLLDASLRLRHATPPPAARTPALLLLALALVVYVAACASLPWISLALIRRRAPMRGQPVAPAAATAATRGGDGALPWNAADAWGRSRRALLVASFCMLFTGGVVALIGILTFIAARRASISPVPVAFSLPPTASGHVPLPLVTTDLFTQVALAGVGLMVGWAVVRQGILIERRLPQRGFMSHWRGTTIAAALLSLVVAAMAAIESEGLPELLVLVALVTCAYALFTWQSYIAHDHLLTQLRPFIASLTNSHVGWLAADPLEVERSAAALFTSLCRDVLQASRGRLAITVGRQRRVLTYQSVMTGDVDPSALAEMRDWVLPVSDERGVVAQLELGPRLDGAGYTSADLEIARACGQRILDAVGEFAAAQVIASLARQRGLEAELSAALPRRVLHDEVLPRLHVAIMRLESLRARIRPLAAVPAGVLDVQSGDAAREDGKGLEVGLEETQLELTQAHRDLAALMRSAPMANLRRLEQGFAGALRAALEGEFRGSFDAVRLSLSEDALAAADSLPPIVADLLLGATLEAIRNASKHARGEALHRPLTLEVELRADERWITTLVRDDGVGLRTDGIDGDEGEQETTGASASLLLSPGGGAQSGLLTHGALMGLVGGALHVESQEEGQDGAGTSVTIQAPRPSREPA